MTALDVVNARIEANQMPTTLELLELMCEKGWNPARALGIAGKYKAAVAESGWIEGGPARDPAADNFIAQLKSFKL